MNELEKCRAEIDRIDKEIVKLYEERMKVSESVAEYKIGAGKNVLERTREEEKLAAVKALTNNDFNSKGIEELYQQIMSMSRKKQYALMNKKGMGLQLPFIAVDKLYDNPPRVVFQGVKGAYSEEAMIRFFGEGVDSINVPSFRDAMCSVEEGSANFAVLPIENSSAGIVSANYDLLSEFEDYIVGEQIIEINNCLIGLPGATENDIKTVYSHPQALMQSAGFLEKHDYTLVSYDNTAMAAKKVKDDNDITQGAVCGERAAKLYGLDVIKKNINFSDGNSTRFIVVTNQKIFLKDAKKVSISFEIPHQSGSLYRILSHFIYNDLNMNNIESRPIPDRPWEYRFFVDFDGNLVQASVKNALMGIREEARNLRVLGNY
ncbi:MAG: chorismate mutase [Lachnospiraceae bacterium]|nr:chorismate mutase [Lachnospiraceae bacterium]